MSNSNISSNFAHHNESPEEILTRNLQRLLQEYNLTEAELARRACLPQPTVHKILTGKTDDPRISTVQALANFFSVTIDSLYSQQLPSSDKGKPNVSTQSIPIISWHDCLKGTAYLKGLHANNWSQWAVTDNLGQHLFGLKTKPAMEPQFARGSTLIVDPNIEPLDGDYVIVHYANTSEATLRKILIDGPRKNLVLLNGEEDFTQGTLGKEIKVLGVITQVRMDF